MDGGPHRNEHAFFLDSKPVSQGGLPIPTKALAAHSPLIREKLLRKSQVQGWNIPEVVPAGTEFNAETSGNEMKIYFKTGVKPNAYDDNKKVWNCLIAVLAATMDGKFIQDRLEGGQDDDAAVNAERLLGQTAQSQARNALEAARLAVNMELGLSTNTIIGTDKDCHDKVLGEEGKYAVPALHDMYIVMPFYDQSIHQDFVDILQAVPPPHKFAARMMCRARGEHNGGPLSAPPAQLEHVNDPVRASTGLTLHLSPQWTSCVAVAAAPCAYAGHRQEIALQQLSSALKARPNLLQQWQEKGLVMDFIGINEGLATNNFVRWVLQLGPNATADTPKMFVDTLAASTSAACLKEAMADTVRRDNLAWRQTVLGSDALAVARCMCDRHKSGRLLLAETPLASPQDLTDALRAMSSRLCVVITAPGETPSAVLQPPEGALAQLQDASSLPLIAPTPPIHFRSAVDMSGAFPHVHSPATHSSSLVITLAAPSAAKFAMRDAVAASCMNDYLEHASGLDEFGVKATVTRGPEGVHVAISAPRDCNAMLRAVQALPVTASEQSILRLFEQNVRKVAGRMAWNMSAGDKLVKHLATQAMWKPDSPMAVPSKAQIEAQLKQVAQNPAQVAAVAQSWLKSKAFVGGVNMTADARAATGSLFRCTIAHKPVQTGAYARALPAGGVSVPAEVAADEPTDAHCLQVPLASNLSSTEMFKMRCLSGILSGWNGTLMADLRRKRKLVYSVMCGIMGAPGLQSVLHVQTSFEPKLKDLGIQATRKLVGDWRVGKFDTVQLEEAKIKYDNVVAMSSHDLLAHQALMVSQGYSPAHLEENLRAMRAMTLPEAKELLQKAVIYPGFVESTVAA